MASSAKFSFTTEDGEKPEPPVLHDGAEFCVSDYSVGYEQHPDHGPCLVIRMRLPQTEVTRNANEILEVIANESKSLAKARDNRKKEKGSSTKAGTSTKGGSSSRVVVKQEPASSVPHRKRKIQRTKNKRVDDDFVVKGSSDSDGYSYSSGSDANTNSDVEEEEILDGDDIYFLSIGSSHCRTHSILCRCVNSETRNKIEKISICKCPQEVDTV